MCERAAGESLSDAAAASAAEPLRLESDQASLVERPYQHHFGFTFMGIEL